jgi:hypothetical protein
MAKGKALIRAGNRSAAADRKTAAAERATGRLAEPSVCEQCGAVFARRLWRRRAVSGALLDRATWTVCPACRQSRAEQYCGRVIVRGGFASTHQTAILERIRNAAMHAARTQPQRRVISAERVGDALEVLTTSQKLAHRIVRELKKSFRGRASYRWSDDGSLFAVWERD